MKTTAEKWLDNEDKLCRDDRLNRLKWIMEEFPNIDVTIFHGGRNKILCTEANQKNLEASIDETCEEYPFVIDAWILLPDHIHCIWTLPHPQ